MSAYLDGSTVTSTGAIDVTATSNPTITTTSTVAAVSAAIGAAVAVFTATTTIGGTTQAYLQDATLTATGQAIQVTATSTENLTPTVAGGAGGLVGVAVLSSTATVNGSTLASLEGETTVSAGSLTVTASDSSTAAPVTNVGGVGGISVNNASSTTTLSRQTEASIPADARITMLTGSLTVAAVSSDSANTSSESGGFGIIAVTNIDITSTVNSLTSATVDAGAVLQVASGNVAITATSANNANATSESIAGGGVDVQVSTPMANDTSTTQAYMLGNLSASGVLIESTANDQSLAGASTDGGGLVQVGVANVTATTTPTVKAQVGGTVHVTNDIGVDAIATSAANTTNNSATGGIVNVAAQNATVNLNPNVSSDVAADANLIAGGNITVDAEHDLGTAPVLSDGTFNAATAVSTTNNTITLDGNSGLQTGDLVTYAQGTGNAAVGGLTDSRQYSVIATTPTALSFGATFSNPAVNTATGAIHFAAPDNFQTGDEVVYEAPANGTAVGGLVSGNTYIVNVIDPQTITLVNPPNSPQPQSFTGASVSNSKITIANNGFTAGEAVTYHAPMALGTFDLSNVNGAINTINVGSNSGLSAGDQVVYTTPSQTFTSANVTGNEITIPGHGFTTGETLNYQATGSAPLQLPSGQNLAAGTYYAIRVDANTLELAATLADATAAVPHPLLFATTQTGASGTLTAAPLAGLTSGTTYFVLVPNASSPNEIQLATTTNGSAINYLASTSAGDASVSNTLRNVANPPPIGGLTDGETYYVENVNGNSFQLASDSAGRDIVALTPYATGDATKTTLTGTSTLGAQAIPLTSQATGTQTLVLKLLSAGTGTQTLEGVGGAAALSRISGSGGVSIASVSGAGGGAVQVASVTATVTGKPTVSTTVEAGVHMSAANVDIESAAMDAVAAVATGAGGGLVQVGVSNSNVNVNPTSTLLISANAVLDATGNITVQSTTSNNAQAQATSAGGGLVAVGAANVTSTVSHSATVEIGNSATLNAQGNLDVESQSSDTATATSTVAEGGLVATATNTTTLSMGSSSSPAVTTTSIDSGAMLKGNTVTIGAAVNGLNLTDTASESAGGVGAGATANALMTINDSTQVNLATNSTVSGNTVTINSVHENVNLNSQATANVYTLVGYPASDAKIEYDSQAQVNASTGARVAAGTLNVNATQQIDTYQRTSNAYYDGIRNGGTSNKDGAPNAHREIDWNGNIAVLSAPSPVLVVDANGMIAQAVNVSVGGGQEQGAITGSTVSVDPINNNENMSNAVTFTANPAKKVGTLDGESAPQGDITGTGTLSDAAAFYTVTITNDSNKDLVINGIQTVNPIAHPTINLKADSTSGFTFTVDNTVGPTDVTIDNEGTGNVVLNAPGTVPGGTLGYSIYNPVGTTTIIAKNGSVLNRSSSTDVPTIWTQTLDVAASGSVGTSTNRLSVNLVLPDAQTDLNITAGGNVFLDLTGVLREDQTDPTFLGGTIQTPGQIDLLLEPIIEDIGALPAGSVYAYRVDNGGSAMEVSSTASPDPRVFPDYTKSTPVAGTYQFDQLIAGGNITINESSQPSTVPAIGFSSEISTPGQIYAHISGDITLTETTGNFNIARVASDSGDVALTALNGSIVAAVNTPPVAGTPPWVQGDNLTFTAFDGGIGLQSEFLQIVSTGVLTALAKFGVYLIETSGNLNIDEVLSRFSDVALIASKGSILNAAEHPLTTNIQGQNIELQATSSGKTIGSSMYPLEILGAGTGQDPNDGFQIDTYAPGIGNLVAQASGDIDLMETSGALNVLSVVSAIGNVSLTVHNSVLTGEDLNMLPSGGTTLLGLAIAAAQISAPMGSVSVYAGDNVTVPAGASITAGTSIVVEGDYSQFSGIRSYDNDYSSLVTNPNAIGAIIAITGNVQAPSVAIGSGSQTNVDFIELLNPTGINPTPAGVSPAYTTTITGGGGDDRIFIDALAGPTTVARAPGAERIYVASNASRALFTVGSSATSSQVLQLTGTPTAGQVYQLTLNGVAAAQATTFSAAAVTGNLAANTINVGANSGLTAGSQVTYTTSQTFTPAAVNSQASTGAGIPATIGNPSMPTQSWSANQTFNGLATTGGSGTGLTVNVTTDSQGNPTAVLNTSGSGYNVGDSITITETGASSATSFTMQVLSLEPTITLDGHGFATGEALLYHATTPLPLAAGGTLQPGAIYYAIRVDANTFELADSNADALAGNPLQFASPVTGSNDQTLTAAPVGGLTSGCRYYVLVPDSTHPNLIQLATTPTGPAIALTPSTAAVYLGAALTLSRVGVDPAVTTVGVSDVTGTLTANTVNVGPSSGLTTGDQVTYTTASDRLTPVAGLVSGKTYSVIVPDPTHPNLIQLACTDTPSTPIALTPSVAGADLSVANSLSQVAHFTYTVPASQTTLQNAASALAAQINSPNSPIPGYSATVSAGGTELIISRADGQAFTAKPALSGTTGTFITVGTANDGYYDDTGINPLNVLAGSLADLGNLTIDTGAGGNGGTRDAVYISAAGSTAALIGTMSSTVISGLGIGGNGQINFNSAGGGASLYLELGNGANTMTVTGVSDNVAAYVYGGTGANTFNVGTAANDDLSQVDGILGVFGAGNNTTLNVYGNASPGVGGQLTAIGISGMGMGTNTTLRSVHNNVFGAGFNSSNNMDPAVVYYGERGISDGIETITSSVQQVNVYLGAGPQTFNVDSTYASGTTNINAGSGNDTITVGSTVSGLHAETTQVGDVAYVAGALNIMGAGTGTSVVVNASGGDFSAASRIGQLQNNTVTGLGMAGSIGMSNIANAEIDLGPYGNTFYLPSTVKATSTVINAGTGFNTVYLGTAEGGAGTGSLAGLRGSLTLSGSQAALAGNEIAFDDQSDASNQTWMVSNTPGASGQPDTTTVTSSGMPVSVSFQRFETVVLNGGGGNDIFDVYATQREQDSAGGHSSTFTINTGGGNDTVNIGTPQTGGVDSLDDFLINTTNTSGGGVPVMVNGQGGNDTVQFMDTASTTGTNLAFVTQQFTDIFPNTKTAPTVTAIQPTEPAGANEQYQLSDTATGGTFNLTLSGVPGQQPFVVQDIPYNVSATSLALMIEDAATVYDVNGIPTQTVTVSVTENSSTSWTLQFSSPSSGITLSADGSNLTSPQTLSSATGLASQTGPNYSPPAETYLDQFSQIFGAPADATAYNTVALSQQASVCVSKPTTSNAGNEQFTVTDVNSADPNATATGGTFDLTISGVPNQASFLVQDIPFNVTASALQRLIADATDVPGANNQMTQEVNANVTQASSTMTGMTSAGSATITGLASTNGLVAGMVVTGTDLTGGPYTISVVDTSNNSITLNAGSGITTDNSASLTFLQNNWTIEFTNPNSGITLTADGSGLTTPSSALNVHTRGIQTVSASLGSGNNVVQLTGPTAYNIVVNGDQNATGTLNFNVAPLFDNSSGDGGFYSAVLNGGGGANTLFANYANGVKDAQASVTFNGGTTGNNTLRIQGDGVANGTYTPSATQNDAGVVNVNNNVFTFGNTQTLIVHGLNQLMDVTPSGAASDLNVDSQAVASLNLPNLILHQVTVQGVVTWTQQQTITPQPAQQALHLGKVSALSADGNTLVLGADLKDPSSDISTLDSYGAVFVYTWNSTTNAWVQQAQLEPGDLALRKGDGDGFGDAVSITPDGSTMAVGAPGDVGGFSNAGAVYVFRQDASGSWVQVAKLKAIDMATDADFGTSVSITGSSGSGLTVFVGSPGNSRAYAFTSTIGSAWTQESELNVSASGFGDAVAVSGELAVVGAPGSTISHGKAYVYQFINSMWSQVSTLCAPDSAAGDGFGTAVAIDGNLVVVGDPEGNAPVPTGYQSAPPTPQSYVNAGEAFVFNLTTAQSPVLEARLTETDGLPQLDAAAVGQTTGDQFGAAVAIAGNDTAGYYVVVGAPGYNLKAGAAYVFYRLPNQGSGNGPSWTRSSGSSGSGQLTPAAPQHAGGMSDPLAGLFGGSVVVGDVSTSGGRIVVGMEGYNQTNSSNAAANAGAVRTYTTNGTLPSNTDPNVLDAEILDGASGQTSFGQDTVYDPTTQTLFVAAPSSSPPAIDVYANEGLYWSYVEMLSLPAAASYALAASGDTLVVGAPVTSGDGQVLIYTYSNGTWPLQPTKTITGGNFDFGYSVAIDGSNLVVGSPQESVSYSSAGQGDQTGGPNGGAYQLQLGDSGAAYTYQLIGGTWTLSNLLMPDDNNLPNDTSTPQSELQQEGTATFDGQYIYYSSQGTQSAGKNGFTGVTAFQFSSSVTLGPRTQVTLTDVYGEIDDLFGTNSVTEYNYSYTQSTTISLPNDYRFHKAAGIIDSGTNSFTISIMSPQAQDATYSGLNNARWGSSVAIVGNSVAVGAPGVSGVSLSSGVSLYNLGGSTYSRWTAYGAEVSGGMEPLTPSSYQSAANPGLGTVVALQGAANLGAGGQLLASEPQANSNAGAVAAFPISGFNLQPPSTISSGTAIAVAGNEEIIGAPSGVGSANLYNASNGNSLCVTLTPFNSSSSPETADVQFGVGASLISEGFYVVGGTNTASVNGGNTGLLYDFRQRGPAWAPLSSNDLLTTTQNPLAEAGSSVAISGDTFAAGAPKYNNSGAVFISNYDSSTQQWLVQPEDLKNYDNFGSSVALDGNTLVVGADNKANGAGAVYIFQYVGGQWTQVAEFLGQAGEQLGTSVGVSGTEAIAGAPGSVTAYLYSFNGTAWSSQQTLTDTADGSGSGFGSAVAIDGDTAVIGVPNVNTDEGAAYVYVLNGTSWSQQGGNLGALQPLSQCSQFGSAVAVSGGEIIVGAPNAGSASSGNTNSGAAYMFKLDSTGTWKVDGPSLQSLITLGPGDHFGASVAINGQQVLVGAYGTGTNKGTAYSFSLNNGYWELDSTTGLLPGGAQEGDMVGYAVALSGSNAVLGAPQQNGRTPYNSSAINTDGNGYAYIRNLSPPITVTVPERQETLIQGAQANEIVGTVSGVTTANLYFFDTPTVSLQTNAGTDSTVTISSAGLTAFGLLNFSVNNVGTGNDTLNVNSTTLAAPAGGEFAPPLSLDPPPPPNVTSDLPYATVTSDQITFSSQDNLITGQLVEYHAGAANGVPNSPISGLTDGGDYYVTVVNPTTIELSLTLGGPVILDLKPTTATGGFFDTRVEELPIQTASAVSNNEITFAQPDNLVDQQTVVYHAGSTLGTPDLPIGGLTDGATYYVIVVNPTTIELSSSAGGRPIALDPTQATGTGHFLSAEVVLKGVFSFGGTGTNTLNVDPNNAVWTLSSTSLTDPQGNQLQLNNVSTVTLTGGAGSNTFTVDGWTKGTVTLNGGSGSNTYNVYTSGGASNVNVNDPNGTGALDVFGDPTQKNQFTVETNDVIWNGLQTITYTGIQTLTVTGQSLGDNFLEEDSSAGQVDLIGVSGSDLFQVFQGTTQNTQVIVHGIVPTGVSTDTDELDLPTTAIASATNTYNLSQNETVTYDPTITVELSIMKLPSTKTIDIPDAATVILQGKNLMINGTAYDLTPVTNLTLDGSGTTGAASFSIDSILSTLTTLTLTGGGAASGNNTLAGPSAGGNVWQITGTNSGQLLIGGSSTPNISFTGMANLTAGSNSDDFEFLNNGGTSTGNLTGNLAGGGGELDDSGVTASVTVNLAAGTATDIGGTLSGITNFVGNAAVSDTLAGPNAANTWQIATTNSGTLVSGMSTTFIFSGFSILEGGSVSDSFIVSSNHTTGGITGTLTIHGGSGTNQLTVDDSGSTSAEHATITASSIAGLLGGGTIDYSCGNFTDALKDDGVLIEGGSAGGTYDIQSTLKGNTTKVVGGDGNNTFLVSSATGALTGGIADLLTIDAGSGTANRLIVDDSGSTSPETATITASSLTGLSNGTAEIDYSATDGNFTDGANNDGILIKGDSASGTYDIQSTQKGSTTKVVAGSGNNTFLVTSVTGSLTSGIAGLLAIDAGSGTANRLTVDDSGSSAPESAVITATGITGLSNNTAVIDYAATNGDFTDGTTTDGILIKGSSVAGTYQIQSTLAGSTTDVVGGMGNDVFNVGTASSSLGLIKGNLALNGLANDSSPSTTLEAASNDGHLVASNRLASGDTVNFNDQGDNTAGGLTYTLTSTTLDRTGLPETTPAITYAGLETVNLNTALQSSVINVLRTAANVNTTVNGSVNATPTKDTMNITGTGAGSNSTFMAGTGDTTFNLETTGTGSFTRILGNAGNDTINVSSNAIAGTPGNIDGINGTLLVDAGAGNDNRLFLDDSQGVMNTNTIVNSDTITGFGKNLPALFYKASNGGHFLDPAGTYDGILIKASQLGGNTFSVRSTLAESTTEIQTSGSNNTFNVGSEEPMTGGIVDNIQGGLNVAGAGADTMNVDDTGSTTAKTGTLTATSLTGLNMGPLGIIYSGLSTLNISLGSGGSTGNTLNINVAPGTNLPPNTNINAGSGGHDKMNLSWGGDYNGTLHLSGFTLPTISVGGNFNGSLFTSNPGAIGTITIGGSLTASGVLDVFDAGDPKTPPVPTGLLGDIGTMSVGGSIAGLVQVSGNITTLDVGPANTPTANGMNDVSGQVIVGGAITTVSVSGDVSGLIQSEFTGNSLFIGGSLTRTGIVAVSIPPIPKVIAPVANLNILTIGHDLAGTLTVTGTLGTAALGGSISYTGVLTAGNLNSLFIGKDMGGEVNVTGMLKTMTVDGGTPGKVAASQIGTIGVYAGYGPVVGQIEEFGVQRLIEATVPSAPFPTPAATPQPPPSPSPAGVTFQYFYEGLLSPLLEGIIASPPGLTNAQLTIDVSNQTGSTAPDQFDLSLVTYNDSAKFNLTRLDATGNSGVSGIRNVAVEGDILSTITQAASKFFGADKSPAGVYLPHDNLAGVSIRGYVPNGSIDARSIQAVAFGSMTPISRGPTVVGALATAAFASELLAPGTAIIQAGSENGSTAETFRVPFSDTSQVGFFMDDTPGSGVFDNRNVALTVQGVSTPNSTGTANIVTPSNVARGSVIALITVAETFAATGRLDNSVIETVSMRGDGGSIQTQQTIGSSPDNSQTKVRFTPSITSTGPLGDVSVGGALPTVTAPSIFGSIVASGSIPSSSTIETTGLRIDPITGALSQVPADLGRVYVATSGSSRAPVEVTTIIAANGAGLAGQIICGGNLISGVNIASGGSLSGQIVTIGNLNGAVTINGPMSGVIATNGSMNGGVVIGGPLSGGKILCVGNINGNVLINGSLESGRIAKRGSILGNLPINGTIDRQSAIVSGGSIGKALTGGGLSVGSVAGILASVGPMHVIKIGSTSSALLYEQNDATDTAAIDDIFSGGVVPLSPTDLFDEATPEDLLNLARLLANLSGLSVVKGKLT